MKNRNFYLISKAFPNSIADLEGSLTYFLLAISFYNRFFSIGLLDEPVSGTYRKEEEFEVNHLANHMYLLRVRTADKRSALKAGKVNR